MQFPWFSENRKATIMAINLPNSRRSYNRERIYSIAAKVYGRGRRGSYDLNVDDV